jgi:hypothetical protein
MCWDEKEKKRGECRSDPHHTRQTGRATSVTELMEAWRRRANVSVGRSMGERILREVMCVS